MSDVPTHEPACHDRADAVDLLIEGRPRDLGDNMIVSRLLPAAKRRMVGPFVFLDHMGPVTLPPGAGFDVRPHPHIGLSTVTYFLAGENVHRDSLGTVQTNRPFDINLMTAGRGVVHSERADPAFRASGGLMHGIQIWLALPTSHEDVAPSFEHHPKDTLPAISPAAGVTGRVLIGTAFGATSPIRHPSEPLLVDLHLEPGARISIAKDVLERAVFVIDGAVELSGHTCTTNQLAVLKPGELDLCASQASHVMLLGGGPLGARMLDWNFVATTKDRIDRAREAWKRQEFPTIPTDHDDFIPYPELEKRAIPSPLR